MKALNSGICMIAICLVAVGGTYAAEASLGQLAGIAVAATDIKGNAPSAPEPVRFSGKVWVGEKQFNITRADTNPCKTELFSADRITLDSWAYSRAYVAGVCFKVYAEGVTEAYRTDLEKYLKVQLSLLDTADHSGRSIDAQLVDREGNNAVFYAPLTDLNWAHDQSGQPKSEVLNYFKVWDAASNSTSYHSNGLIFFVEHTK
jgi:hypothetical protein